MKRLLICLLLVGVVGCGKSEQTQEQSSGETEQAPKQPSKETEQKAIAALERIDPSARIERDDAGNVVSLRFSIGLGSKFRVTDADLEHLKGLASVKKLSLPYQITDTGLVHLKGLTKLEDLRLFFTKISDAGLEHLKSLTKLEKLDLEVTQVTDAGIAGLQKVLPNCEIKH